VVFSFIYLLVDGTKKEKHKLELQRKDGYMR